MSDWEDKLSEDYPQFPNVGNPKLQYEKISTGRGEVYYIDKADVDAGRRELKPKADTETFWQVTILGNRLTPGYSVAIALLIPEFASDEDSRRMYALAYNSVENARKDLCDHFGECRAPEEDGWFEFYPDRDQVKSGLNYFVNAYADKKKLVVYIDNFEYSESTHNSRPSSSRSTRSPSRPKINSSVSPKVSPSRRVQQSPKTSEESLENATFQEVTGGLRTRESYTHNLNQILDIVTLSKATMPVGSFKYNIHKYPGDIDIFERYDGCCSVEDVKEAMVEAVQNIILKIKAFPDVYLGDFKAGEDKRYAIDIGKWEDNRLRGFSLTNVQRQIKRLRKERLITEDEFEQMLQLSEMADRSRDDWEELSDNVRKNVVLRWNSQEILAGQKVLQGSETVLLSDALAQRTLVKIDIWAKVNGRYMEVTNFFMINVYGSFKQKIATLTQELPDYEKSIAKDVRFYSSAEHRNTLKALKRLWSLALFKKDYELGARISPLFKTNASALHQMNGEAEVLAMMLVKLPDPPTQQIMEQIDGFKPRIDQLSDSTSDNEILYGIVNEIVDPYFAQGPLNYRQFEEAYELLQKFQKMLKGIVERLVAEEARNAGLQDPAQYV